MEDSVKKVAKIIGEVTKIPAKQIKDNMLLIDDLNLSSLQIMMILSELLRKFSVQVSEEELLAVRSVGDLAEIIKQYK